MRRPVCITHREFAEDFITGGLLVALALFVSDILSPVLGGFIAGLPIRFAVTWGIAASKKGPEFAEKMAKGSVFGIIGSVLFSMTLYLSLSALDFFTAFFTALAIGFSGVVISKTYRSRMKYFG